MQSSPEIMIILNSIIGITVLLNAILLFRVKQLQDERYIHVLTKAGRNSFVFLMIILPVLSIILLVQPSWLESGTAVFAVWIASFIILYSSGYFYYRR
ncbi:MAG: hypothetical protein ACW98Y_20735 [Candidatus Thorarchaeota archaeon]|jgi:uncharacterized membrane protein